MNDHHISRPFTDPPWKEFSLINAFLKMIIDYLFGTIWAIIVALKSEETDIA